MQDALMEIRIDLDSLSSQLLLMANAFENDGLELSSEDLSKSLFGLHRYLERVNAELEEIDLNYSLVKRSERVSASTTHPLK